MKRSADILLSPGLVLGLAVLVANDLWLKPALGNALTGKLSDFAGLFVFPLFWSALLPRWRMAIHLGTAVAFVWWKSAASQPFIDFWNARVPFGVTRTVDPTDLVALLSIPLAYWYATRPREPRPVSRLRWATVPAALLAFGATSVITTQEYRRSYSFPVSESALLAGFDSLRITRYGSPGTAGDSLRVRIPSSLCFTGINARLQVQTRGDSTELTVTHIWHRCRSDSQSMLHAFERCLVQRLDSLVAGDTASVRRAPAVTPRPNREDTCTIP